MSGTSPDGYGKSVSLIGLSILPDICPDRVWHQHWPEAYSLAIPLILSDKYSGVMLIEIAAIPVVPLVGTSGVSTYSTKPVVPSI